MNAGISFFEKLTCFFTSGAGYPSSVTRFFSKTHNNFYAILKPVDQGSTEIWYSLGSCLGVPYFHKA
jgi:hypothetical protein